MLIPRSDHQMYCQSTYFREPQFDRNAQSQLNSDDSVVQPFNFNQNRCAACCHGSIIDQLGTLRLCALAPRVHLLRSNGIGLD